MTDEKPPRRWRLPIALVAAALAVALAGVLYGTGAGGSKEEAALCPGAKAVAARLAPLAQGEVAALNVDKAPRPAVAIAFDGADGRKLTLADFKGRSVLLNLWATWCVPCRAEMPALDRLQAKVGGADFEVVAINIDTSRLDRPPAFLEAAGVRTLARYADSSADSFEALKVAGKALGLPTSLLIGPDGCELAVMAGPARWDSDDALKLVAAMTLRGAPKPGLSP
ncbi:MAG: TlpA disulfide reductase family protein [Roseiarcus sp.]